MKHLIHEEEKLRILDIHKKSMSKQVVNEDIKTHFGKVRKLMGLPLLTESIGKIWADLANATKRSDLSADQIYVLDNIIKGDTKLLSAGIKSVDDFIANKNTAFSIIKATSQNTNTLLKQGIEKIYGARLSSDYVSMNDVLRTKLDTFFGAEPIFRSLITNKFSDVTESSLRTFKSIIDTNIKNNTTMSDMVKDYLRKMSDDIGSYLNDLKTTVDDINIDKIDVPEVDPSDAYRKLSDDELVGKLPSVKGGAFHYLNHVGGNMSGWKFHVYAEDLADMAFLTDVLTPIAKQWDATAKVGGPELLYSWTKNHPQWGKQGITMYIPPKVIANGQQGAMRDSIISAIKGYRKKGTIKGDAPITDNVTYRYEMSKPVNMNGVPYEQYKKLYDEWYSINQNTNYKPEDVPDLFQLKKPDLKQNIKTQTVNNFLSGKRVSSRWAYWKPDYIDFSKMSNIRDIESLDKQIAYALKTGNYGYIPRKGFEKFGVDDLRKLFTDGVSQINRANPDTGDWSVNFK